MLSTRTLAAGVMAAVSALTAQSQRPANGGAPAAIRICTGADGKPSQNSCEVWNRDGTHYNAAHVQNPPAILAVESFAADAVVLRVTDAAHPGKDGTRVVYGGKMSGDGSSVPEGIYLAKDGSMGTFKAYWGGALAQPMASTAGAVSGASPVAVPQVLHFCAAHCLTFTLERDGRLHNYTNLPGQFNEHRILEIQKFTPDTVVIHRTDMGSHPGDGMMHGGMQAGNNTASSNEGWRLSWGDALNDLPGSDDERAMREHGTSGQQPGLPPVGEQNLALAQLLFSLFSPGAIPPDKTPKALIGCAPGNMTCAHVNIGH